MSLLIAYVYFLKEDFPGKKAMRPFPPLNILSVSAYLQISKIEHDIFDGTFSNFEMLTQQIVQKKYKQIAIYTNSIIKANVLKLIAFIRSKEELKDTTIILFGPDAKLCIEEYIEQGANMIITGEEEEAMKDLINTLNVPVNPFLDKVAGIAFKNYFGKIIFTEAPINIKELPFPNREKIDIKKYLSVWKSKHGTTVLNVSTKNQHRSVQNVCDELVEIQKLYHPDTIRFEDEIFTNDQNWLHQFADETEKRNLAIHYECVSNANKINDAVFSDLKRSGCFRILLDTNIDRNNIKFVQETLLNAKKWGLETVTMITLGDPGESESKIFKIIEYLVALDPGRFTVTTSNPSTSYLYAVRLITNEVKYQQLDFLDKIFSPLAWKYKLKSILAQERIQRYSNLKTINLAQ